MPFIASFLGISGVLFVAWANTHCSTQARLVGKMAKNRGKKSYQIMQLMCYMYRTAKKQTRYNMRRKGQENAT